MVHVMRIAESDWKVFKAVREVALDRFCQQVLRECRGLCDDESRTAHERYGDLYGHIRDRNGEMARAFDDYRRSTAVLCLMQFQKLGLLTEDDIGRFSDEVQRSLKRD